MRAVIAYRLLVLLVFAAAIAITVWNGELSPLGHVNRDVANSLYIGKRVLHGDLLYVDWYHFVTPPIVFLSAGACQVAELLGLRPQTVFHLLVIATAGLGAWVIRDAKKADPGAGRLLTLAYLGVLVAAGSRAGDFGQREHLFALLFVPYLVWRLSRRPVTAPLLALAFGLGFAAMIKPHFLVGVALGEAFSLGERRGRRALWTSLSAGAIAPFALLALEPRAWDGMFERMIPYHLGRSSDVYASAPSAFLFHPRHLGLLALGLPLLAAAAYALAKGLVERRVAVPVLAVALAFYLAIWQQQMFFSYHLVPFQAVAYVFLLYLSQRIAERWSSPAWRRAATGVVVLLPLLLVGRSLFWMAELAAQRPPPVIRSLAQILGPRSRILLVSPTVEGVIFTYALRRDLEIVGPWTIHYTLPALVALEDPEERERAIRRYFAPLEARIRERRPDLVLFSPRTQGLPPELTLHHVIVDEYRLFPIPGYRVLARTPDGWVVYANSEPAGSAGRLRRLRT